MPDEKDESEGLTPDPAEEMSTGEPAEAPTEQLPPVNESVPPTIPLPAMEPVPPARTGPMPPRAPEPPAADAFAEPVRGPRRGVGRAVIGWIIALLILTLLISIVAALLTRGSGSAVAPSDTPTPTVSASTTPTPSPSVTPSPSQTSEPTPSPTPTETTPAPPPGPTFVAFDAPSTAQCPNTSDTADVTLTWVSKGAIKAWVGINTDNAKSEPYAEAPPSGSMTLPFPCSNPSQKYTVTLQDADGKLAHKSATVTRSGS